MAIDTSKVRAALEACRQARGPDSPLAGFNLLPWLELFEELAAMAVAGAEAEPVTETDGERYRRALEKIVNVGASASLARRIAQEALDSEEPEGI